MARDELAVWACFDAGQIVGVIATRPPCHVALLFVDGAYHRRGIARALYETAVEYHKQRDGCGEMTVHSSPYAHEAYKRLGFADLDAEQTVNGLRFIPMKHVFDTGLTK